jgi:hypothetical protein
MITPGYFFPLKEGKKRNKLNGDVSKHYAIKAYGSMEDPRSAFCRLIREQESLIIQSPGRVSVLTNSKDQSPSEEVNSSSAGQ